MSPLALDPWHGERRAAASASGEHERRRARAASTSGGERERRCAGSMACERWPAATKALKREWRAASERPTARMGIEEIEFVAASRNERSRHQFTMHGSMGQGL